MNSEFQELKRALILIKKIILPGQHTVWVHSETVDRIRELSFPFLRISLFSFILHAYFPLADRKLIVLGEPLLVVYGEIHGTYCGVAFPYVSLLLPRPLISRVPVSGAVLRWLAGHFWTSPRGCPKEIWKAGQVLRPSVGSSSTYSFLVQLNAQS